MMKKLLLLALIFIKSFYGFTQEKGTCFWCFPIPEKYADTILNDLKSIKHLILKTGFYNVKQLPFDKLENLEYLNLSQCKIDNLPLLLEIIGNLPHLEYLDLAGNRIDTIKFIKGSFPSLKFFSIEQCGVKYIDSSIGGLQLLEFLNLGLITGHFQVTNKIETLPNSLSKLQSLKTLVYADNKLLQVPSIIFDLKSLQYLNVSGNSINFLPKKIISLTSLKVLDIGYNNFYSFPNTILSLKKLTILVISGNKIKYIPTEIFDHLELQKVVLNIKGRTIIE